MKRVVRFFIAKPGTPWRRGGSTANDSGAAIHKVAFSIDDDGDGGLRTGRDRRARGCRILRTTTWEIRGVAVT